MSRVVHMFNNLSWVVHRNNTKNAIIYVEHEATVEWLDNSTSISHVQTVDVLPISFSLCMNFLNTPKGFASRSNVSALYHSSAEAWRNPILKAPFLPPAEPPPFTLVAEPPFVPPVKPPPCTPVAEPPLVPPSKPPPSSPVTEPPRMPPVESPPCTPVESPP
eukprot:6211979-Pleurochrysis_carterae.AAC.1